MKTVNLSDEFVSYQEAAKIIGVSRQAVYDMVRKGDLLGYKVAGSPRILRTDAENLAKSRSLKED